MKSVIKTTILLVLPLLFLSNKCQKTGSLSEMGKNINMSLNAPEQRSSSNEPLKYPVLKPAMHGHRWKDEWTKRVWDLLDNDPNLRRYMRCDPMCIMNLKTLNEIGCPQFPSLSQNEKKKFWATFFASMSHKEGRHMSNPPYFNIGDAKRGSVSTGLMQINSLSATTAGCRQDNGKALVYKTTNAQGGKHIKKKEHETSMRDPMLNIKCAMYMLKRELGKRRGTLYYPGSYWAIFRRDRLNHKRFHNLLKEQLKVNIPACLSTGERASTKTANISQEQRSEGKASESSQSNSQDNSEDNSGNILQRIFSQ